MNTNYVMIVTTVPTENDARRIAEQLVTERLAACAQMDGPIQSIYHWDEQIQHDSEFRLSVKTSSSRIGEVFTAIRSLHPYQVPQLVAFPICAGSVDYLDWMESSIQTDGKTSKKPNL
ncbi:MAG: divalent-cation tolerance protein CutA [Thermoguttaceae bacterium]|nr:divalent-cation tolerance protein CutA [Thermoguttaceae bacterium]